MSDPWRIDFKEENKKNPIHLELTGDFDVNKGVQLDAVYGGSLRWADLSVEPDRIILKTTINNNVSRITFWSNRGEPVIDVSSGGPHEPMVKG